MVGCDTEPVHPLVEVATGFSAVVYRTSDGGCLKVAREAEVAVRHRRETALLGVVAGTVGVDVQWPARDVPASGRWPHGAVLCPWLPGRHLSVTDEPAPVAAFLRRLADVPVAAVAGLAEPYGEWWPRQRESAVAGLAAVDGRVEPDVSAWLREFVAGFERYVPRIAEPSFVHGDLWSENMLACDSVLTGVVDWEFAAVGDPAADLAGLWYLGDAWVDGVLAELRWPPETVRRAQYFRVVRELYGAAWSVRHDDRDELADSLTKTTTAVRAVLAAG